MLIDSIPIISVSYNSEELISDLLSSLRRFYSNPVTIIDGSDEDKFEEVKKVCTTYENVKFIHFDYNIHHGPGMAWALQNLNLNGPVLVLDSDIYILKSGFLEDLNSHLKPGMYGVGYVNYVNEGGFDVNYEDGSIPYLHPACMLINSDVVNQWPMPTKHGAPMIEPMLALHRLGQSNLVKGLAWVKNDFLAKSTGASRHYLRHDWQGTVNRSGGYNLEEWTKSANEASVIRQYLIHMLPAGDFPILEMGESDGQFIRTCKEIFPGRLALAIGKHSDKNLSVNFNALVDTNQFDSDFFRVYNGVGCWVLNQFFEKISDPTIFLSKLRQVITLDTSVLAVIPNAQHWSLQLRLMCGDLSYSDQGLLNINHRRLYSRNSILDIFYQAGYKIDQCIPVVHNRLSNEVIESAMKTIILQMGVSPELAFEAAQVDTYIIKAVPN